ncbi:GlxA family transcriptional regulator [Antarcticimicrobium luteum]|uniref:GlxA family transcriptional regulator n=1 Tax=Antarcticimicrobium luteum TaxID=2547397 RepID=A0A4R5VFN6_9RHOB|nr:GlxA family transcriptional regulator [Antarcticimicrobium luteum]
MRKWRISREETEEVAVLLFPRFSNHCLANAIEPLRAANDLSSKKIYRWQFVTLDGAGVTSSSGLPVVPECRLSDHPGGDYLFVMPSYGVRDQAGYRNLRGIRGAARRFRNIVGMDTGSWLLAAAGMLDGSRATIHHDEMTSFSETFEDVDAVSERFVVDGNLMTCGGAMSAFDLVLNLIGRTHGEILRLEVASLLLFSNSGEPPGLLYKTKGSLFVDSCVALMSANLETPLPIADLARQAGTTQRQLNREFQAQLGASPKTVYKRLRLMSARRYAEQSGYSVAEIALRCGYQNPAAMTRAFVEEFGAPPTTFRQTN